MKYLFNTYKIQGILLSTMATMGIWNALTFLLNGALSSQENVTGTAEADMEGWGKYGDMSHAVLLWKIREGGVGKVYKAMVN